MQARWNPEHAVCFWIENSSRRAMAQPERTRSALEVLDDHLAKRCNGAFEQDLAENYAPDVAMLTANGVFRGFDGVRMLKRKLDRDLPNAVFSYTARATDGNVAFLEWTAQADGATVEDGADSYFIVDGLITAQTIHYTAKRSP